MAKKSKQAEAPKQQVPAPTPRLLERYEKEIRGHLAKKLAAAIPTRCPGWRRS